MDSCIPLSSQLVVAGGPEAGCIGRRDSVDGPGNWGIGAGVSGGLESPSGAVIKLLGSMIERAASTVPGA